MKNFLRGMTFPRGVIVVSLLAFVGSVSVARYIGGMLIEAPAGDGAGEQGR